MSEQRRLVHALVVLAAHARASNKLSFQPVWGLVRTRVDNRVTERVLGVRGRVWGAVAMAVIRGR